MIAWAMARDADNEFQRLLQLARDSAHALHEAGIAPRSPTSSLHGWLAIERLDFTDVTHADGDRSNPQWEAVHFEQIWLTVDGHLRNARRERTALVDAAAGAAVAVESDVTRAGTVIAAPTDIGARWDGPYEATSRSIDRVERTIQDKPHGPREDAAMRIANALHRSTAELLERRRPDSAAPASPDPVATRARSFTRMYVAGALMIALIGWVFADFNAAFSLLLWSTPLLLLMFAAVTAYVGFSRFGGAIGFALIVGTLTSLFVLWAGYVVVVDLWFYDDPRPCAAFVEGLPGGAEFCAPRRTGAEQWDPPLWHFAD